MEDMDMDMGGMMGGEEAEQLKVPNCDKFVTSRGFAVITCVTALLSWLLGFLVPFKLAAKKAVIPFALLTVISGLIAMSCWADLYNKSEGWFELRPDTRPNGMPFRGIFTHWEYGFSFVFFIVGFALEALAICFLLYVEPNEKPLNRTPASAGVTSPSSLPNAASPASQAPPSVNVQMAAVAESTEGQPVGQQNVVFHQETNQV